jgi:transcriptional regulator with XRE-family HTH domain
LNTFEEYGLRLKEERKRLGLTQPEMAKIGGIGKGSQIGYEGGVRPPDLEYLKRISEVGADIMFIMSGRGIEQIVSEKFDWKIHDQVLKIVEKHLDKSSVPIDFEKKMNLLRLYFHQSQKSKIVDEEFIQQALQLMT